MNVKSDLIPNFRRRLLIAAMLVSAFAAGAHAQTPAKADDAKARAELQELLDLQAKLLRIAREDYEKEPHKSFFKANEAKITYSEPSAEYYVRSELFWALEKKYRGLSVADDIAWEAAKNPLPGECEGYLNCNLYVTRITLGEYLKRYPSGLQKDVVMLELKQYFAGVADEAKSPVSYTPPEDASDKAEVVKLLGEFETIMKKVEHPDRTAVLADIKRVAEAFK